jgi:hypothetical protein
MKCQSPVCRETFEESGIRCQPKRFCCDQCKLDVNAIRRTAKILADLPDKKVIEIIRRELR